MGEELKISILRNEPNRLTLKVQGEDHTLLNLLTEELQKDGSVVIAAYREEHPLTREYTLTIITDGSKAPFDALAEAAARLKELFEELRDQWLRAVEG
ncbi:MAG: RpoL/Rpb11 RNA polymerase subunit family protein [Thermofilaceae archaeon]